MRQKQVESTLTRREIFESEIADLVQRNSIKASVYRAFRAAEHLKSFGERFRTYTEPELQGYTVHILAAKDNYHPTGIRVWGKGINHSSPVDITWYTDSTDLTWQDQMRRQLDRELFEKRIERLKDQLATFDIFEIHEKRIAGKLNELQELRFAAQSDIPGGIEEATPALQKAFPTLFE